MGKERNVPWEEILRRRKEGETARALAEEFGVSVESVYKRGQRERRAQRGSLQQAARNLCRSAGSMVAQMEDMDAKELKELTALLRELLAAEGLLIKNHVDCGCILFDANEQSRSEEHTSELQSQR